MSGRPSIRDESVLMKWMHLELGRLNGGIVAERKTLEQLMKEESPATVTKTGRDYRFRKDIVRSFGERLPLPFHAKLRLPILFYFDSRVHDSCFLVDEPAFRALVQLGELSPLREMEAGRLWVGKPIIFSLMRSYPTLIQIVMR